MVRELRPCREEFVPVARFQCRGERFGETFSFLPCQLIPYYKYTIHSVVFAILFWGEIMGDSALRVTGYHVEQQFSGEVSVTDWMLQYWLKMLHHALNAAHSEQAAWYDFSEVRFSKDKSGWLETVLAAGFY